MGAEHGIQLHALGIGGMHDPGCTQPGDVYSMFGGIIVYAALQPCCGGCHDGAPCPRLEDG